MKTHASPLAIRGSGVAWMTFILLMACCRPTVSFAAAPTEDEQHQIEILIGAYYLAVAAEDVDEVVDLHHWANSFERDKIKALVEQAFAVADSEFERVRIQAIDLFPERSIGLARVGVDYRVRSFDGADAFSGHLDAAFVLVRGPKGWRIGKVGRAADLDLTTAVSQFQTMSQDLETSVPVAPVGLDAPQSTTGKLQKLATAPALVVQNPAAETGAMNAAPTAPSTTGGLTFFALRRKGTGECAVVAGVEGILPGDTIYGAFPDFGRAQETLTANCSGGRLGVVPPAATDNSGHN